jgi:carbonic anhydrase/acetyltransferase-like protein (isoleucine patch superfamily)
MESRNPNTRHRLLHGQQVRLRSDEGKRQGFQRHPGDFRSPNAAGRINPSSSDAGIPNANSTSKRSEVMPKTNSIRPNLAGDYPQVHPSALIDPSAQIIGNVIIEKNVFVAPLAVIRADERGPDGSVAPIVIGEEVNIQDGVIIHSHGGATITIGPRTSVAHGAAIHGPCTIGEDCFLAMRCCVYSATLANEIWVGMGALIMRASIDPYTYVAAGSVIRSRPDAWGLRVVSNKEKAYMKGVLEATNRLREDYFKALTPAAAD